MNERFSLALWKVKLIRSNAEPREPDLAPRARKLRSILVTGALVLAVGATPAPGRTGEEAQTVLAAKMKNGIAQPCCGEEIKAHLTLFDNSVLVGFIGKSGDQQFELISPETDFWRAVSYDEIKQLRGQNSSNGVGVRVGGKNKPLKALIHLAQRRIPGNGRGQTARSEYLSKPAVVVLVVLAVGVILIGVELGKS